MDNAADAEDDADLKRRGPVGPPMAAYTSRDLGGLTVEHDVDQFQEGKDMVLTLKDAGRCLASVVVMSGVALL